MKKIKELIDQVGKQSIATKRNSNDEDAIQPSYISEETRQYLRNPLADMEAIDSIDPLYFDVNADVNTHELESLVEGTKLEDVETRQKKLRRQLNAVSKKLSDVILENQPSYTKELKEVQELQRSLHKAFVICSNGRRYLMSVSLSSTTVSLALLNHQQKRQKLRSLFEALQTIKTLQHTDVRLREMLEEEDYDGAIQLCLECLKAASIYKHYQCIKDLSSKLQDTLELMEEQIDVSLSKICSSFDEELYTKLQIAYQMLGKTQSAIDQLLMHYTTSIHNAAFRIVMGYAELENANNNLQKKQYNDVCKHVTNEIYVPCLIDLCKALWTIMNSYHKTSRWHFEKFASTCDVSDNEVIEYVNRKLTSGRHRVWTDVQSRVRIFILSSDLSNFKYDDFIAILDIVKRFISVGDDFCRGVIAVDGAEPQKIADNLKEPLRKQTLSYFRAHHASRMEELIMFLENEAWQPCPVRSSFNVLDMQEFKFLKDQEDQLYTGSERKESEEMDVPVSKYFDSYSSDKDEHPFMDFEQQSLSKQPSTTVRYSDFDASDDDDINDELHGDFVDEKTGESPTAGFLTKSRSTISMYDGPIMTNTALHVLRLCGRYMKMCDVLKTISLDVVECMCQLFDLYYYAIYSFFTREEERKRKSSLRRLSPTIDRLEETLFLPLNTQTDDQESVDSTRVVEEGKVRRPMLSPITRLYEPDNCYGISERIVATESLVCLSEQFQSLQKYLEQMIPSAKKAFLLQFYSQTVQTAPDVRWPVYYSVVTHAFDHCSAVDQMTSVNWDIREIMSQHNPYVDQLLTCLTRFKEMVTKGANTVELPEAVMKVIWGHAIHICNYLFVEGFSNVKKCSNEGRALMQLDYQQFLMKLEKLTNIKPIPKREHVEAYIKAYYLTESDLESWVREHDEYSPKQLSALLSCSAATYSRSGSANRLSKQRMMSIIDDLKNRR